MALKNASDGTFGAGYLNFKITDGGLRSNAGIYFSPAYNSNLDTTVSNAPGYIVTAGYDNQGILVGSGTNDESFEDYALQTKITTGNGAGQLSYTISNGHALSYNPATKTMTDQFIRYFNNNSGASINVNEVGLVTGVSPGGCFCMMSRDKLASTVAIPNTGQLKVTYTIQMTFPA